MICATFSIITSLIIIKWKYSTRTMLIIGGTTSALYSIIYLASLFFYKGFFESSIVRIVEITSLITACFFLAKYKDARTVFSVLTSLCFNIMMGVLTGIFILFFHNPVINVIVIVVSYIFLCHLIFSKLRPTLFVIMDIVKKGWAAGCIIPLLLLAAMYSLCGYPVPLRMNQHSIPATIVVCFIVITSYSALVVLFRGIINEQAMEYEKRIMKIQLSSLQLYAARAAKDNQTVDIFHHDLRHFANIVTAYINSGNYDEAIAGLNSISSNISQISQQRNDKRYCENEAINAIIAFLVADAEDKGIKVESSLGIPGNISVDSIELALVFANAIENAVNACGKMPEDTDKRLRMTTSRHGRQLLIEIANTYTGNISFDKRLNIPISTEIGHGIGSYSIRAFAEKYNAALRYRAAEGWFTVSILIDR